MGRDCCACDGRRVTPRCVDVELSGQACLDGPRFVHAAALSRLAAGRVTWVDSVSAATVVATFACLWLMRVFDFALLSVHGLI